MDMGFVHHHHHQGTMSSAQLRKIRKPIIERRRRERINRCLDQIKSLVLKALNQDESKYEKMDKADILEMAVRHLVDAQRPQLSSTYRAGYNRCAAEVKQYLHQAPGQSDEVQKRLLGHLNMPTPSTAATSQSGICRPQPVMAPQHGVADSDHPATLLACRHSATTSEEEDSCLDCSTVSSTSSSVSSSSTMLSPIRERHDSGLSEDYSVDRCGGRDSVPCNSDIHDHSSSAFREVKSCSVGRPACSVEYCDKEESDQRSTSAQRAGPAEEDTGSVWRPW